MPNWPRRSTSSPPSAPSGTGARWAQYVPYYLNVLGPPIGIRPFQCSNRFFATFHFSAIPTLRHLPFRAVYAERACSGHGKACRRVSGRCMARIIHERTHVKIALLCCVSTVRQSPKTATLARRPPEPVGVDAAGRRTRVQRGAAPGPGRRSGGRVGAQGSRSKGL